MGNNPSVPASVPATQNKTRPTPKSLDSLCYYHADPSPAPTHAPRALYSATDATSKLGLDTMTSLLLVTPMKLLPGAQIWIHADYPVRLLQHDYEHASLVDCRQPIRITANSVLWLLPMVPLNDAFATGWSKLSTELKVRIIEANLSLNKPVRIVWGERSDRPDLLHHLRTTPEIASLAREIFYTTNTFALDPQSGPARLVLPNRDLRPMIRQFQFVLFPGVPGWARLNDLANIQHTFDHLRHVEIVVNWRNFTTIAETRSRSEREWVFWLRHRLRNIDNIQFQCAGAICFKGVIRGLRGHSVDVALRIKGSLEDVIKSKISFRS